MPAGPLAARLQVLIRGAAHRKMRLFVLAALCWAVYAAQNCVNTCDTSMFTQNDRPSTIVGYLTYEPDCLWTCLNNTAPGPNMVNTTTFCVNFPFCLKCVDLSTGLLDTNPYNMIHLTCASFKHLAPHANTTVAVATTGLARTYGQTPQEHLYSAPGFCSVVAVQDLGVTFCPNDGPPQIIPAQQGTGGGDAGAQQVSTSEALG